MKKSITLIILIIFLFSGCSAIKDASSTTIDTSTITEISSPIIADESSSITEESTPSITTAEPIISMERENADVRNAKWGDSIETVKKYETAELLGEDTGVLLYYDTILSSEANIIYHFSEDYGLYEVMYGFDTYHTNDSYYITNYDKYKESLTEKYGTPSSDEILNNREVPDIFEPIDAIAFGYTLYRTRWALEKSDIMLGMSGDNYEISTLIAFRANDYTEPIDTSGF